MASRDAKKLSVALVGLGRAGHFHMTSLGACRSMAWLKYVIDIDEQKAKDVAARYEDCKPLTSLAPALEDPELDVVVIASTTHQHFEQTKAALLANKAVLVEKPISHNPAEIKEIVELATAEDAPAFMVGFQRRFDEHFVALRDSLKNGAVGAARMVKCTSRDNPEPPMWYLKVSDGIFHDMCVHDFDMIHFLTGEMPESVFAVGVAHNPEIGAMDDCDTVMVTLTFKSGLIATVDTSRVAEYGYDQRVEVLGAEGMLQLENVKNNLVTVCNKNGFTGAPAKHSFPQRYPQAYSDELKHFLTCVYEGRSPPETVSDIERYIQLERICSAAEISQKRGIRVELKDLDKLRAEAKTAEASTSRAEISLEEFHDWKPKENAFGDSFRNYEDSARQDVVKKTYYDMHRNQTVDFVKEQHKKWLGLNKGEFTIMEMIEILDSLVDESDPDNDLPNSIHDFQTAERIRQQWPDHDWFHLVGLLHDIGKVLACPEVAGTDTLPQWAVVGDTFCVGCAPSKDIVFGLDSFEGNPDINHPIYGKEYGIYDPNCGVANLTMSWGHDEYMYWVLKKNGCTIPEHGLNMIRFHSFYPWHEKRAYTHLERPEDLETLKWVKEFNKFDLYSKGDDIPDVEKLKPYYQSLLEKYNVGGKLRF